MSLTRCYPFIVYLIALYEFAVISLQCFLLNQYWNVIFLSTSQVPTNFIWFNFLGMLNFIF